MNHVVKEIQKEDIIELNESNDQKIPQGIFTYIGLNLLKTEFNFPLDIFPYDQFFHQQIIKKKKDHSYRIFKKVNRLAGPGQFPSALEYSWGEKPIVVWCSNDYLGMSCHPEVKNSVR